MPRLVFTAAARDDLADLVRYIARQSRQPAVARAFAASIRVHCSRLAGLPGTLGRERLDLGVDIRSAAFRDYVIVFRYRERLFEVLNVIEGHRDIPARFDPDPS